MSDGYVFGLVRRLSRMALLLWCASCPAGEVEINGRRFELTDGFELSLAASQPLVDRPITAAFDELGRLYVADSSGSNDPVEKQLRERPHRILRLEDSDGDGQFDKSHVFADRMMFPEGTMWLDGSLYVAAPPSIWKLTDTDGDGVADKREEWFDGKTLTGCANDLHGPYVGIDGWVYWCKGAFAEQTYQIGGKPWTTRAAHIFRRHPSGGLIEPVMTGGMDNPVDVVFMPSGERVFTTTFLQHPRGGRRDGLIHALYGGLYGKVHSVIEGHPRTGDLLPPLVHLGAAAPCGLERLQSAAWGRQYQDNLFAALFNMQKVTRHVLTKSGASFEVQTEDFLSTTDIDFHPTDIIEDADGSLLVVDTGGWYKLCCPTSQLHKPDVLGGIYRIRRVGASSPSDPRGRDLNWPAMDDSELARLLGDDRPVVRRQAQATLVQRAPRSVPALVSTLASGGSRHRTEAVWTLCRIEHDTAQAAVRSALDDDSALVRQAAVHAVSLHRDGAAVTQLTRLLSDPDPQLVRAAAEALGRIGDSSAIPSLLDAARKSAVDRALEHSLIYSLIEIDAAPATRSVGLAADDARVRNAVLIALDQMPSAGLTPDDVEPLLGSDDQTLNETGWWLVSRHPEWASGITGFFHTLMQTAPTAKTRERMATHLPALMESTEFRQFLADRLSDSRVPSDIKRDIVRAAAQSRLKYWPEEWRAVSAEILESPDSELVAAVIRALHELTDTRVEGPTMAALSGLAQDPEWDARVRLEALAALSRVDYPLDLATVEFCCAHLPSDQPPLLRALAVEVLTASDLGDERLHRIIDVVPELGPMELLPLLSSFGAIGSESAALSLIEALHKCPAAAAVPLEKIAACFSNFVGDHVADRQEHLVTTLVASTRSKTASMAEIESLLDSADIRRGQAVFNSTKASCRACHEMGYLGGDVGPDLTRIGRIRTPRDLIESILFPSLSFVRSYEPVDVVTVDGKVISGLIRDETGEELIIAIDAQKTVRIRHDDIDERRPGKTSVMPAGLEKQLTKQQLADLVKFLHAAR